MDDPLILSHKASKLHRVGGSSMLHLDGDFVTSRYLVIPDTCEALPQRDLSPKAIRRFLHGKDTGRVGRPFLLTWYNAGTGTSELRLGLATKRKKVADQLLKEPGYSLVELDG